MSRGGEDSERECRESEGDCGPQFSFKSLRAPYGADSAAHGVHRQHIKNSMKHRSENDARKRDAEMTPQKQNKMQHKMLNYDTIWDTRRVHGGEVRREGVLIQFRCLPIPNRLY